MTRNKTMARFGVQICGTAVAILGLILACSPFILGYERSTWPTCLNVAFGSLLATFGACRALMAFDARSVAGINIFLGVLVVLTGWAMQSLDLKLYVPLHLICGFGAIALAAIGMLLSHLFRPMVVAPWTDAAQ